LRDQRRVTALSNIAAGNKPADGLVINLLEIICSVLEIEKLLKTFFYPFRSQHALSLCGAGLPRASGYPNSRRVFDDPHQLCIHVRPEAGRQDAFSFLLAVQLTV